MDKEYRDEVCDNKCDWSTFRELADEIEEACKDDPSYTDVQYLFREAEYFKEISCLKDKNDQYCTLVFYDYLPDDVDPTDPSKLTEYYDDIFKKMPKEVGCQDCMNEAYKIFVKIYNDVPDDVQKYMYIPKQYFEEKCGFASNSTVTPANATASSVSKSSLFALVALILVL
jgi:hypothetical protein